MYRGCAGAVLAADAVLTIARLARKALVARQFGGGCRNRPAIDTALHRGSYPPRLYNRNQHVVTPASLLRRRGLKARTTAGKRARLAQHTAGTAGIDG